MSEICEWVYGLAPAIKALFLLAAPAMGLAAAFLLAYEDQDLNHVITNPALRVLIFCIGAGAVIALVIVSTVCGNGIC